ncbi:uncharacterized protein LOC115722053 [Cannabis sativa]|uniref:uncharacterized protein LOC115722053 n=3 Tax=Cannabis sativa TaxID=3483 RepID=UPI0029CA72B6|nr:uncharacterized protein LOC115722053 [Cannabis sativa]
MSFSTCVGLFIMEPAPNDDDEWAQYEESFMPEEHNNEVEEPNIEVEEPNIEVEEPPPKQKNTRGRTKRLDITRLASEGKKLEIEYNNLGQQWGKAATDLVSRIGVWVRINIPLVNKKWPQIDKELKNRLWNDVKGKFELEEEAKRRTIQKAGERWRDWKNTLTKGIYKVKDVAPQLLEKPPRLYEDIIDETEWTEFVASRLTKEWGVTRKNAQASRAKNIYPHRSGRGGARMVELQMEKELGHQLVKIDRADLWKRLRTNSKGELEGPAVEVAQRIDDLRKQLEEGTISVEGKNDILTMALGTDEHGGRVRGLGYGVTQTQFFHTPRPTKRKNKDEDNEALSDMDKRLRETEESNRQLKEQMAELLRIVRSQHSGVAGTSHASGSGVGGESNKLARDDDIVSAPEAQPQSPVHVSAPRQPSTLHAEKVTAPPAPPPHTDGISEKKYPCWLHVRLEPSGLSLKVAKGFMVKEQYLKNGKFSVQGSDFLYKDYRRVFIDEVYVENARLPCPVVQNGYTTVGHAVGLYVAWLKDYITPVGVELTQRPNNQMQKKPPVSGKGQVSEELLGPRTQPQKIPERPSKKGRYVAPKRTSIINNFFKLLNMWPKTTTIHFEASKDLFGVENDSIWLPTIDIKELCQMGFLGAQPIAIWCKFLKERLLDVNGLSRLYAFLNPGAIASDAGDYNARSRALRKRILEIDNPAKWIIAPYNNYNMYHWMVVLIQPSTHTVAYLDSNNGYVPEDLKYIVNTSLNIVNKSLTNRNDRPIEWITPICPQQPDGKQCGYYVMKFIESFMNEEDPIRRVREMGKSDPYSNDEMNILRDQWIEYVRAQAVRQGLLQ